MASLSHPSSTGWLRSLLNTQKGRVGSLLNEIKGLGIPAFMKPEIFRKFLDLLSQIAAERAEENDIIARIEAVEAKHRFNRTHNQLELANPLFKSEAELDAYEAAEKSRNGKGLWGFLKASWHPEREPNYDQ